MDCGLGNGTVEWGMELWTATGEWDTWRGNTHVLTRGNLNVQYIYIYIYIYIEWKPLIMTTLGPALFDNNNRLITLSGGYKNSHYLTQFIVTIFYMYKKQQNLF